MAEQQEGQEQEKDFSLLGDFVRLAVLTWSIAMLSLNYLGYVKAMDPTFPASLLTGTMASFGVNVGRANGKKKDDVSRVEETTAKR
tara:strand:+ start:1795 stop:2052 length:258 start_codon:yes stop_codon:yes gene_type:complete